MARPCFLVALLEGFQLIGIYYQIDIQWQLYHIYQYLGTYELLIAKELFYNIVGMTLEYLGFFKVCPKFPKGLFDGFQKIIPSQL